MSDITEITNITDEQKRELREKSMRYMVDSPSSKGLSPQVIKQRMVGYVLDDTNSIIAIIDGLIDKINTNEANLQERIEDIETSNEFIVVESASGTLTETQVELLTNNNNCYLVYKDASNNYEIYKLAKKESTQYLYDCILGNSVKTLTLTLSSGAYSIASLTNENVANKVTTLDNSDDHYPSAKAVKTKVDDITEDISDLDTRLDGAEDDISDIKQAYVVSAEIVASGEHEGELKLVVAVNGELQSPIYFEGGGLSSVEWGQITGTLADQTDLKNALDDKVDKVEGKGLSENDFTDALLTKLNGIEAGAEVNVNADWNAVSGDAQILNKPTIPAAQIQSDWSQSDNTKLDYIKNKPDLAPVATSGSYNDLLSKPTIPTKTSDLINDGEGVSGTDYQFASKNFVNSSVATNTAYYLGNANQVSDLHLDYDADRADVADALALFFTSPAPTNNDYCFVQVPTSNATPTQISRVDRYKYNSQMSEWIYEYTLNNSSFTAAQWDAINSGITVGKVSSYDSHISNTSNPHNVTASQVGLGNVDNTSDATKKTNFTGSIASDNTGFVLGGDVYTALSGKQATIDSSHKLSADLVDDTNSTNKFITASDKTTWNGKSVVSVSDTGTATDEVNYITVNGTEKKLAGGAKVTFVDWS